MPKAAYRVGFATSALRADSAHAARWQSKMRTLSIDSKSILFGLLGIIGFSLTLPATRMAVAELDPTFVGLGRAIIAALDDPLQRPDDPHCERTAALPNRRESGLGFILAMIAHPQRIPT